MTLSLRQIDAEWLQQAPDADGVIKASELASLREARDVIARARHEAEQLLEEARTLARAELQQRQDELEEAVWRQAADHARALQSEWELALEALENRMATLLGRAVRRLVDESPPEARLRACLKQLLAEAGSPDTGVLIVSSSLQSAVHALEDQLPWLVEFSDELPAGTVRLQAAQGRWDCVLESAMERLAQAMDVEVPANRGQEDA